MKPIALTFAFVVAAPLAAQTPEKVMCSTDGAKAAPCTMTITATGGGDHVLVFAAGGKRVRVTGKSQTGWWSGTLDGRPAMGIEINRGYTRWSTADLTHTFDWFYPGQQHGTY